MSEPLIPYTPTETFPNERILRNRMERDLSYYAEHNLKLIGKEVGSGISPVIFNRAQRYIHEQIEEQRKATGKVRALIVKARQMGCSTYVAARYYWRTTHRKGVNAFVLSHAKDTTLKLFTMTRRYHDYSDALWKPDTESASAHEFKFSGLDSSYYVGTAGSKETGRGGTIQYFHGSEVAFWANADMHFGGIMQSVPTGLFSKGSEVILESTGNGESGKFYELCEDARKGKGEYILIFTPWFWQEEYQDLGAPIDWTVEGSEHSDLIIAARESYNLSYEQCYWMELKRIELGSDWLFRQEYPATYEEAFQTVGDESFVPLNEMHEAMVPKPDVIEMDSMACIGALDPAGVGEHADRTAIGHMIGSRVYPIVYYKHKNTVELTEITRKYIEDNQIDRFYVDSNGLGVGIYEALVHTHKLGNIVKACNFGGGATDLNTDGTHMYKNMRVQCYGRFLKWIRSGKRELPQQEELRKDMCAAKRLDERPQAMESKKSMKKRGIKSPDGSDVVAMFFTHPVTSVKRLRYFDGGVTVSEQERAPDYDELGFGLGG